MAGLDLKEYQRESLEAIGRFCAAVRKRAGRSERPVHDAYWAEVGREFIQVPQLPGIPYFCLRVPTGGGKTLIAAHAVGEVAKHLEHHDRPLCLWVTPSTTIRDQTLRGLRDREHPYRVALRERLGGVPVEVLTIEEALAANRAMLSSSAVIVVTTIQSYRIDDEKNRKVYQDNGYLMDHFTNLPVWVREQLAEPNGGNGKRISLSLANVMKLRGPIVIMDEAHAARTRVSFDSLARFGPLAVLELTATPQLTHAPDKGEYASNVLHAVSALQLKREGMIKLPVELERRDNWLDVLALTVQRREMLAERAATWGKENGRYIRPIALIQAQPDFRNRDSHTVFKIKEQLLKMQIAEESIRIVYKNIDELGDEDIRRPDCKVEYILTVEKLREGWDCPFAYVLGSVGSVATETAVEQLLGRVLRMPDAKPTGVPELDRAYAVVQSEDIDRTARNLADSMVRRCGFDMDSIADVLRVHRQAGAQASLAYSSIPVSSAPNLAQLPPTVQAKIRYEAGTGTIKVHQPLSRDDAQALRDVLTSPTDREAVENYWQEEREVGSVPKRLDEYATPLRIPQMAVRHGQRWLRFEPLELEEFRWDLDKCSVEITEADFSGDLHVGDRVEIDVTTGQGAVRVGGVQQVIARQLSFLLQDDNWDKVELVRWLDHELHRGGKNAGLAKAESQAWLNRVVDYLVNNRGIEVPMLVRKRHELANVTFHRITDHGRQQIRKVAELLFGGETERHLETTREMPFEVAEQDYAPYRTYKGIYDLKKHAFDLIGEMGNHESECAKKISDHDNVVRWVRNLEHESAGGFSLPLSPGRFFPDFLVELADGRTAIVEYKNSKLAQVEGHKKDVGEMWAARSDGRCVFVWVVERDWDTLEKALNPVSPN